MFCISAVWTAPFIIHLLESIISKLYTSEDSIFWLVSVAEQAGLSLALSENSKADFAAEWISVCLCPQNDADQSFFYYYYHTVLLSIQKFIYILPNYMLSQWDRSFEHPKQILKLMDKKLFTYNITLYAERRLKSVCAFSVLLYIYWDKIIKAVWTQSGSTFCPFTVWRWCE